MRKKLFNTFIIVALICFLISGVLSGYINSSVYAAQGDETEETEQTMPFLLDTPELSDEYKIVETYDTEWSDIFVYDMQYNEYDTFPHYVVNLSGTRRKIYEVPDSSMEYYGKLTYGRKLQVLALVEDENEALWYAVVYEYEDEAVVGYIQETKVSKREFQFEEMNKYLENVTSIQNLGHIVYVENYKNLNGTAPRMPNGSYYDEFGNRRGQAIAGYYDETLDGEFRYIPDGTLGIVEQVIEISEPRENIIIIDNKGIFASEEEYFDEEDAMDKSEAIEKYNDNTEVIAVKMYIPSFDESLWVKQKYVSEDEDAPDVLKQAIIVDRLNQNIAVFEYDGQWNLISLSYSSTGKVGEFSVPTPLGYFMAITKKPKFDYVEDGTNTIVGFAPYAIRFSAGGYLHGVPMSYTFDESGGKVNTAYYVEYLSSIGTIPKSHMCVRNYTSHAEFMYEWVDIGNCTVIVIE